MERGQASVGVDCTAEDGVGAGLYLLGVASPDVMRQGDCRDLGHTLDIFDLHLILEKQPDKSRSGGILQDTWILQKHLLWKTKNFLKQTVELFLIRGGYIGRKPHTVCDRSSDPGLVK